MMVGNREDAPYQRDDLRAAPYADHLAGGGSDAARVPELSELIASGAQLGEQFLVPWIVEHGCRV